MEDYVSKRNYLNHLKQISAIKNGHCKSNLNNKSVARLSSLNINFIIKENISVNSNFMKLSATKRVMNSNGPVSVRNNQSTEKIMKSFNIEKENLRLVERIGTISSEINMKKY
jgi:hypothetical protein